MTNHEDRSKDATDLRQKAEEIARERAALTPEDTEDLSPEEIQKILHELRVHQIEMEMQNEELCSAQAEIEAEQARYFDLYDLAPVGYCTLSEKGLILEANLTAATLLGTARFALVKQPISRFILKDDQDIYYLHRKKLFETGEPQEYELRLTKPDGALIWTHLTSTAAQAEDGAAVCRVVISDITERKRTEDELKRFKTISDNAVYGKEIADIQGNLLYVNRFFANIHGYEPEELIGKHFSVFHSQERMEVVDRLITFMIREGHFAPTTVWHRHKDGTDFPMLMSGVLIKDDYGNPQCIAASAIDMTAHQEAVAKLAENETLLSRSQEIAHTGSWKLDLTANRLTWTDEVYRIFGFKPQAFAPTYEDFLNFIHPEDRAAVEEAYSRSVREGSEGFDIEHRIVGRNIDEIRHVHERCIHERDASGAIIQSTGIVQDITEQKQAEATKAEQRALLEAIYRNAPLIMMVVDCDRRIRQVNGFTSQFADRPTEEMLGLHGGEALRCLHSLDDPQGCGFGDFCKQCTIRNTLLDTLANGTTHLQVEADYYPVPTDGQRSAINLLLSSTPLVFNGEHMALLIMLDITEHKALEVQLHQAQKMESVGRLAGGVAHDFNNMLMGIMGYTEMCRDEIGADHPICELLDEIKHGAERSADLTRQLLTFARRQTIAPKVVDLNDTVAGMIQMLLRLIGEDIDLSWHPGANLYLVKVDPGQIDQILANLCVNARDAIGGVGKVTIETQDVFIDADYCATHEEAVIGAYVMLAISDDGCGMDSEILAQLFEPFFTTKAVGEGTGLGLATVYGIVKQNEGFVNVYSEPGKGSTFRIYLPRFAGEHSGRDEVETKEECPGGRETVMLVEDEKGVLVTTALFLEQLGYTVLTAENPSAALQLAAEHQGAIDLLITDVVMPDMSGRALAEKLAPDHPDMKTLYISGYTANVIAHRGILEEDVHFLAKPFTRDNIARKVYEILKGKQIKNKE